MAKRKAKQESADTQPPSKVTKSGEGESAGKPVRNKEKVLILSTRGITHRCDPSTLLRAASSGMPWVSSKMQGNEGDLMLQSRILDLAWSIGGRWAGLKGRSLLRRVDNHR